MPGVTVTLTAIDAGGGGRRTAFTDDFSTLVTVNHGRFTGPQTETVRRPFDDRDTSYPEMPVFAPRSTSTIAETAWKLNERVGLEHTFSFTNLHVERRALPGDGNAGIDGRELMLEPRVRFSAPKAWGSSRVSGIGGLYVFRATQDETIDLFGGSAFDDETTTVAAFGEATVTMRERLDVTVGGRYEREHRQRAGSGGPFSIDFDETYRVFSPKLGVAWRATDAVTVGAFAARGYNGGAAGFTYDAPFVSYTFDPELVWNYETYARGDLLDGRLSLTGNLFVSDYTDMQLPFDLNPDPSIWAYVIRNADAALTYGAEIGARWVAMPGLELSGDFGLLKTEVTDYPGSGIEGHELAQAPAFTSSLGALYQHPRGLDVSVDARFSDAYFSSVQNDPRGKTDPYWLVNAQVGYRISRARIFAVLGNLFDSDAAVLLEPGATFNDDVGVLLRPRSVSLHLELAF